MNAISFVDPKSITVRSQDTPQFDWSFSTAHAFLTKLFANKPKYNLPGDPTKDIYICPVSLGADSTVLAIILHFLFPNINFRMVFTDTLAEPPSTMVTKGRLEAFLGKKIDHVVPDKGLFELVESFNGYLPSGQSRYCTRLLKLESFRKWMTQFDGLQKYMFIGIRHDESERIAFTIDECETEMPFIDLELEREHIFQILNLTVGIPSFYQYRTRSGCTTCMFQRRSEVIGLFQHSPQEFQKGMKYEKVSQQDLDRYTRAVDLWKDSKISANWHSLPDPIHHETISGKRPKRHSKDLFGKRGIYVGAEFFFDSFPGYEPFISHQRLVSYSPELHTIKSQLNDRYGHLLATSEVFGYSPKEMSETVRFAIYYIEEDEGIFSPEPPIKVVSGSNAEIEDEVKSYYWQKDAPYAMIQHIVTHVTRTLHFAYLQQTAITEVRPNSVEEEWKEGAEKAIRDIKHPVGEVVNSSWYKPVLRTHEMSDEEMISTVPCPMCML